MIIPLVPPSLTGSSDLPGDHWTGRPASLFGLAPCGVLPATRVTTGAVRSYRTFSPLPASALAGLGAAGLATCRWLCIFCATFLQVALTGRYPAHCPAEFGLSSRLRLRLRRGRLESLSRHSAKRDGGRSSGSLRRDRFYIGQEPFQPIQPLLPLSSVRLLSNLVLLQLLVQIAPRCADHFGGLGDVLGVAARPRRAKASAGGR